MGFLPHLLTSLKKVLVSRGRAQRYRSTIIILTSLSVLGYELWENIQTGFEDITPGNIIDLLFFGLAIPFFAKVLGRLDRKIQVQSNTLDDLQHLHEVESKIANIQDWDQLVLSLVSFPGTIAPVSGVMLLIYDPTKGQYVISGQYGAIQTGSPDVPSAIPSDFNPACRLAGSPNGGPISCSCLRSEYLHRSADEQTLYCLPLFHGGSLIGMLHLYLPRGVTITPDQADLMTFFAPSIVMAINGMGHLDEEVAQAMIMEDERRQVARYIHDTVGHNLGYLRLKLDQVASEGEEQDLDQLREEMRRMSEVANLAYWQMRMSLASLNAKHPMNLAEALQTNLQIIKEQGRLNTRFRMYGKQRQLSDFIQRRVLLIINELLANLEQHSNPWRVELIMTWEDNQVSISITDDGEGFIPGAHQSLPGHFGLRIIQECTSEINGSLEYESFPEIGNRTTLHFPILTNLSAKQWKSRVSNQNQSIKTQKVFPTSEYDSSGKG